MQIIGNGFIAAHLQPFETAHPAVVALAAGVSSTSTMSDAEFDREARLLDDVLRQCRAARQKVVFFSTAAAAIYGAPGCPGLEDVPCLPQSPYGRHKLSLERRVAESGVDYLILRLGHVVGRGQPPHQLLPALVNQIRSGHVRVYRGARRDLIDVEDVVAALDGLLRRGVRGEVVNVASGVAVPVEDIVDHIERRLGVSALREYVDSGQASSASHVSTAKLRRLVPTVAGRLATTDYYQAVVDRYVDSTLGV